MDVLTSFASSLHQTNEKECLIQLLEFLGSKRHRQSRKLNRFVNKHKPGIQRRVKRFSSLMQKDLHRPGKQSEWPADAMALAIELSTELGKWPRLNATNLHAFRLKVKELRYVLQMASNPDAAFVASLGEVKDAIGEWHDWQVLEMIGKKILSHGRGCNLLKSIHHERMQKFDHALSLANHMRRRYLPEGHVNQHGRLRRRSARLNGPALAATSSLAA